MPDVTLTPVGGDPFNGGAQPLDPSLAPPVRLIVPSPRPSTTTRAVQSSDLLGSGNALHRWDEVGPQLGAAEAFAAAHPNVVAIAKAGDAMFGSLASGHSFDDYERLIDPKGQNATGAASYLRHISPPALVAQAADIGTSLISGHAAEDYAHWADPTGRWEPGPLNPLALVAGTADAMQRPIFSGDPLHDLAHGAVDLAKGVAHSAYSGFSLPYDAWSGQLGDATDPNFDRRVMARMPDLLGLIGTPGLAMAEPGAVGMFGGRLSPTADHAALAQAEHLLRGGAGPDTVRRATGWFRGADGEMRFEISDHMARLRANALRPSANGARLGDVLHHPELYKAYPHLADTIFSNVPRGNEAASLGMYYAPSPGDSGRLFVNPTLDFDEALSTVLHEIQHGIHAREGFNPGANVDGLAANMPDPHVISDLKNIGLFLDSGTDPKDLANAFARQFGRLPSYEALQAAPHFTPDEIRLLPTDAHEAYRRNMGEVEARNVETRRAMTPLQRQLSPPWTTEDVPREWQMPDTGGVGGRPSVPAPDPLAAASPVEGTGVHARALPIGGPKSTAPELGATLQKGINNDLRLNGTLHLSSVGLAAGQGASRAYAAAHDAATVRAAPGNRASPFDLRGPVVPDGLLPSLLGDAAHQRDAERAVLPHIRSASKSDATPHRPAMTASLDLDHSGLREAIHHVRTLKAELASLGTASVSVRHSGFGTRGDHAPGAVRSALNGNFGSDGRAFT